MPLMRILATRGLRDVEVAQAPEASLIGQHWNAIQRLLEGDDRGLEAFRAVRVAGLWLETDPDEIERLARIGEIEIEDIYTD
jgi:hypothetical protein